MVVASVEVDLLGRLGRSDKEEEEAVASLVELQDSHNDTRKVEA